MSTEPPQPVEDEGQDHIIVVNAEEDPLWAEDREKHLRKETYARYGFLFACLSLLSLGLLAPVGLTLSIMGINMRVKARLPLFGVGFSLVALLIWLLVGLYVVIDHVDQLKAQNQPAQPAVLMRNVVTPNLKPIKLPSTPEVTLTLNEKPPSITLEEMKRRMAPTPLLAPERNVVTLKMVHIATMAFYENKQRPPGHRKELFQFLSRHPIENNLNFPDVPKTTFIHIGTLEQHLVYRWENFTPDAGPKKALAYIYYPQDDRYLILYGDGETRIVKHADLTTEIKDLQLPHTNP